MDEKQMAEIINKNGGEFFLVGGAVRDIFLNKTPKDKDYCVTGLTKEQFQSIFPNAELIGKSFPVFNLSVNNKQCEIAFARREIKTSTGYKGFEVTFDTSINIHDDLFRRDTTMNSMAIHVLSNELIDPYNGKTDIENRIINATSEFFKDDPVRSLRVARQASQFGFSVSQKTIDLMKQTKEELLLESKERIVTELEKALNTKKPSLFFDVLKQADLLDIFPPIQKMIGIDQNIKFHPEGDVYNHSMIVLDEVAKQTNDIAIRFAALIHDIGKTATPKELWPSHIGHDVLGIEELIKWNKEFTLQNKWLKAGMIACELHMKVQTKKPSKIVDMIIKADRSPLKTEGLALIMLADGGNNVEPLVHNLNAMATVIRNTKFDIPEHLKNEQIANFVREQRAKLIKPFIK